MQFYWFADKTRQHTLGQGWPLQGTRPRIIQLEFFLGSGPRSQYGHQSDWSNVGFVTRKRILGLKYRQRSFHSFRYPSYLTMDSVIILMVSTTDALKIPYTLMLCCPWREVVFIPRCEIEQLSEKVARFYAAENILSVTFLHNCGIVHG
jgi:hypothetical protein